MGCNSSRPTGNVPVSSNAPSQLELQKAADTNSVPTRPSSEVLKVLLLGAGESGKSTVLKQVKLIYKGGMTSKDRQQCTFAIRKNAIECMQIVLQAMARQNLPLQDPTKESAKAHILSLGEGGTFTTGVAKDIAALWEDGGVREAYAQRHQYWILDAADYYFDNVLRLAGPGYESTEEDVIMTRIRTTGIDNMQFSHPPLTFSVVDVGGQRNERRKWAHCFENVKAVVFLVSLSGYHQLLYEDNHVNKMDEAMKLFRQVAGNPLFRDCPLVVFLNKKDIFEEMISRTSLSVCFPDYKGPDKDVHVALAFVEKKFHTMMHECCPGKKLHVHTVSARVRMDMKIAWSEVIKMLGQHYG